MPKGHCGALAPLPRQRFSLAKSQGWGGTRGQATGSAVLAAPGLTATAPCNAMISGLFQQGKCVPA